MTSRRALMCHRRAANLLHRWPEDDVVDLHVVPIGDLVAHDTSVFAACVCMPTDTPVEQEDGTIRWLAVHHSLDGREQSEAT